jgi:glycerol-3-phosphate acyltransferase PlsX
MLRQFAVMGAVYAREILGIARPLIGLLSIGGEESKGNETTKEALALLRRSPLNVHGNIEGHDLYEGRVDVVVCDGFVGNVVLKTSESVAHFMAEWMREEFSRNPVRLLGAALLKPALGTIRRQSDPAAYGGAPLLGVNGVCIIGHGASSARAVFNAIRFAHEAVNHRINPLIADEIARIEAA